MTTPIIKTATVSDEAPAIAVVLLAFSSDPAALLQRTGSAQVQKDGAAVFEQMGRYHPREPHWFLPFIGVDPSHQGKGYGAALMQHALTPCDRDHTLAYLESSNPKNIPLYERHGFELLGTIQVGTSPPIFPMLRGPRR